MPPQAVISAWVFRANALFSRIPEWVIALVIRLGIADVFWRSGQTKVDGWHVTQTTVQLFRDEYKVPLLSPELAATLASTAEHLFSVLLFLGLASRLSALGLLGMTAVIEIFVYPENWPDHLLWSGSLLYILARGAGCASLDAWLQRRRK